MASFNDRIKTASDGRKYLVVVRNDTLSEIAEAYYGNASKYKQLAAINDIDNPDLIYVGQKIYFSEKSGGSSSSASKDNRRVTVKQFGLQADVDNVLFIVWSWDESDTKEYQVDWDYYTDNRQWFHGTDSTVTVRQATYSIPSNAKQVRVRVKPISKTKTEGDKEVAYWTANWTSWEKHTVEYYPKAPSNLSVSLDGFNLTATVSNLEDEPSIIKFEVVQDNATVYKTGKSSVSTAQASYTCVVKAGSDYKVRCCAYKDGNWGEWSNYSNNFSTIPATPSKFTKCEPKAAADTPTICLEWGSVATADTYEIQYTTKKSNFDISDQVTTVSGIETNAREISSGIENGNEYFFRVRAKNECGESGWSEVSSTVIGTGPAAPTTWSSTTTVVSGDPLTLYWVHNSEDGSSQTYADLEIYVDGVLKFSDHIKNSEKEDEKDLTSSYSVKMVNDDGTPVYPEGAKIEWRVRTMGIANVYGDWSVLRAVDVYAKPTVDLLVRDYTGETVSSTVFYRVNRDSTSGLYMVTNERLNASNGSAVDDGYTEDDDRVYAVNDDEGTPTYYIQRTLDTVKSLPLKVSAVTYPSSQVPIGYYIAIIANEPYETVDDVGNPVFVNEGDVVFSKHYDISSVLSVELSAGELTLENGVSYTMTCTAAMNSGLSAEDSIDFTVSWESRQFTPNAEIGVDEDTYSAYIKPYCTAQQTTYYKVNRQSGAYILTDEVLGGAYGSEVIGATTTTGEKVMFGMDTTGADVYYSVVTKTTIITDVLLSVYRREFDGSFTELISNLDGTKGSFITDPHPALDYARYRIVATSKSTGAVVYRDLPGHLVGEKGIIIQWEEEWSTFDTEGNEDALTQPPWTGSLLRLPYNVDVSNKYSSDTALVGYIGRSHPVAYYGTQRGETATWNVSIDKNDKATLYALRRLAIWRGNVYVREPSGSGYWANITVSFSQKHKEVTIPVTLEVTRVEGGA